MEFGIGLLNHPGCWDDAAFAERNGFTSAGFIDSPLIAVDPFVSMALAAQATSTMRLGTLINIPSMRSAPATASALTAVNQLAPGRVFFGTGTGYTGRLTFGLKPLTASTVGSYLRDVADLVAGREVIHGDSGKRTSIRMANTAAIQNNIDNPIPTYMAADGPKALKVAGREADGWITTLQPANVMQNAPEMFERYLAILQSSATEHGRNPDDLDITWATSICVLEPGESAISPRALRQTGPMAAYAFHCYACDPGIAEGLPTEVRDRLEIYEREVLSRIDLPREHLYQAVHQGHLDHLLDGEAAALTEEIVRSISLTGTAEEIATRLRRLETAGLNNLYLCIPSGQFRDVVVDVHEQIMPLMAPTTV